MVFSAISGGAQSTLDRGVTTARWAKDLGSAVCVETRKRVRDCTVYLGFRTLSPEYFNRMFQFATGESVVDHRWTPLHLAAMLGTKEDVEKAIAAESDLNVRDSDEFTPLLHSIHCANVTASQILLKKGALHSIESPVRPLKYAVFVGNVEAVRQLLAAGARIEAADSCGRTVLHNACACLGMQNTATSERYAELVELLIENGANVNALDDNGVSPIHDVVIKASGPAQLRMLRALRRAGADPFVINKWGLSPLFYAKDNSSALSILFGVEGHPAFASCKNLHDFCEVIWPASRKDLPLKWRIWVERNLGVRRIHDVLPELHQAYAKIGAPVKKNWESLIQASSPSKEPTLECIRDCLIRENRFFAKVWELANRTQKIQLEEVIPEKGNPPALYNSKGHKITLSSHLELSQKVFFLTFELVNALHGKLFDHGDGKYFGKLEREESTLLKEYLEYHTTLWSLRILGVPLPPTLSFQKIWEEENKVREFNNTGLSHTDFYRRTWDSVLSARFLSKHPGYLAKRLKELQTPRRSGCLSPFPKWTENHGPRVRLAGHLPN